MPMVQDSGAPQNRIANLLGLHSSFQTGSPQRPYLYSPRCPAQCVLSSVVCPEHRIGVARVLYQQLFCSTMAGIA